MNLLELISELNFSSIMWQILTPLIFSVFDVITGYIQALINKTVDSQKMRTGLLHKILLVIIIILGFIIQFAFSIKYISGFICVYVTLMEIISILENLKKAGIDIGKLGDVLKTKSDITLSENVNKLVESINDKTESGG